VVAGESETDAHALRRKVDQLEHRSAGEDGVGRSGEGGERCGGEDAVSTRFVQTLQTSYGAAMTGIAFKIGARDGQARSGILSTPRGEIRTPAFMPVGTAGTVKAMLPESVAATGADIVLGNTYHLMLRPGAERVARLGGLHAFMGWARPILTDSGGFQVMSLAELRKLTERGVTFRSHVDGSRHEITPESSMEIQRLLGSDIVMAFDECTPFPATREQAEASMRLSMRWAQRSRDAFGDRPGHALFGIQQGSVFRDLREESAAALGAIGFEGYAIGGLAVGEGQAAMFEVLDYAPGLLPADRPRYLMGVGKPDDIVGAVLRGVDMFDCVLPTRSGRTGQGLTRRGAVNLRNARHADDPRPLDPDCGCPACRGYSRAYLHHVFKSGEIIAAMLLTWHNLHYYQELMAGLRAAIAEGRLTAFAAAFHAMRAEGDLEPA
jgi:queuine tRNA-ribosyltransferase